MIPTEEQLINGHAGGLGVCDACKLEVSYTEFALHAAHLSLCRQCAGFIAHWLSADVEVGTRQRGDFEGDFAQVESTVRTNLQMLKLLGIKPSDEELAALMEYAKEKS